MKRLYFILVLCLGAIISHAQQVVRGTVTGEAGPLQGVSVYEKDVTNNGTTTNAQGEFRLAIQGKGILMVQSVGYLSKEINVQGKSQVDVSLAIDAKGMEDVVVVAYGKKNKITNTGSVSSISGDQIKQAPTASLQNALMGRVTGFTTQQRSGQPGSDGATFVIRGVSTLGSNVSPLIVVDDLEFSGQLSEIDPDQIESVSILKDASTTAVYGIRGANGVVVITTRRGKAGKAKISLRSEIAGQRPTYFPKYLNSYDVARLRRQAELNDGVTPTFSDADIQMFKDGSDPYGHPNIDWTDVLLRKFSLQTNHNLSISGGTDKAKYFISGGYLWQNGMVKDFTVDDNLNSNYYYRRYNFRSNLDFNATNSLQLSMDLSGNFAERNEPNIGGRNNRNNVFFEISDYTQLPPFAYNPYNPNGSLGSNPSVGSYSNSVIGRLRYGGYNRSFDNTITANLRATQKLDFITKGLSLRGSFGYNAQFRFWRSMTRTQFPSYKYTATTDTYTPFDPNVYRLEKLNLGYFADGPNSFKKPNWQASLNYDRNFGNHHVYGLALYNQTGEITGSNIPYYFRGYSFRAGYDFRRKYIIEFNAGYNGSSRFASTKRYAWFPAVSGGWNIAEENFFKNTFHFIDLFKVRASVGLTGSDYLGTGTNYTYNPQFIRSGTYSIGDVSTTINAITEDKLGTDVTWEKERQTDIGVDIKLFAGKLSITADYFKRNRYDILIVRNSVSSIIGVNLPPVNLGEVENKGFEIEASYNKRNKNLFYTVTANASLAKNKIINMDEAAPAYPWLSKTGKSIGTIAGYTFVGYYQDDADVAKSPKPVGLTVKPGDLKYADLNGDGVIDVNDQRILEYPNLPNTILGFTGTVGYKSLTFSITLQSALQFANRKIAESINPFTNNLRDIHANAWTPDNSVNPDFPRLSTVGTINNATAYPSDYWFRRTDYLRIKSAQLSYDLGKKLVSKLSMQSARVYVSGYNLFTWMLKEKNIYEVDPETPSGTEGGDYPVQKIINLGLQINF